MCSLEITLTKASLVNIWIGKLSCVRFLRARIESVWPEGEQTPFTPECFGLEALRSTAQIRAYLYVAVRDT